MSPRGPGVLLVLALCLTAAACGTESAPPKPTPSLASPSAVGRVAGMTFALTPYVLGPWPDPRGFYGPTPSPLPTSYTSPSGLVGTTPRDASGVRVVVRNRVIYDEPTSQAQDGLHALVRYRMGGGATFLTRALLEGQRLIDIHGTSPSTGSAWWFAFLYPFKEYGDAHLIALPPRYSGMAQGNALDLFTQLFGITRAPKWKIAAVQTFASFLYPLKSGESPTSHPWVDRVVGRSLWVEEYPTPNPNDDTINGFGFALVGLTDYAQAFHDHQAQLVAEGGLATWLHAIPEIRHPGGVMGYSLSHPLDLSKKYHSIVVGQLRFFAAVTGDSEFGALADVLSDDFH